MISSWLSIGNDVHELIPGVGGWGGDTPSNGLHKEAPPERGAFSGFRYMKGQGFR